MTMTFCSVTTLWWAWFGSVVREIKRMPTCVRQIRDLLTHVVQPAEDDGTPQCVCGSIRQASLIDSSRLYAV